MKARLAVSMGDPAGIGAEVLLRAAAAKRVVRSCHMTVFGDRSIIEALASRLDIPAPGSAGSAVAEVVEVTRLGRSGGRLLPRPSRRSGQAAFDYLDRAARLVFDGGFDALVTAPINKMWMSRAGHDYDGHTEYLSELTGRRATMIGSHAGLSAVPHPFHCVAAAVAGSVSVTIPADHPPPPCCVVSNPTFCACDVSTSRSPPASLSIPFPISCDFGNPDP